MCRGSEPSSWQRRQFHCFLFEHIELYCSFYPSSNGAFFVAECEIATLLNNISLANAELGSVAVALINRPTADTRLHASGL